MNHYHWTKIEDNIHTRILLENLRNFFLETQILFIPGVRDCAHAYVSLFKMIFFNRSRVGFHIESLSLDKN